MRRIKASSSYLTNQTRKNIAKAALCLLLLVADFIVTLFLVLYSFQRGLFQDTGLIFLSGLIIIPSSLIGFYFYLHQFHVFNGGLQGEKQVIKLLSRSLSDDYYLINDLYLKEGGGDIDHIVLAPAGIFVIETKNWSGTIISQGDEWKRLGKGGSGSSPSNQVKRNVARIKQIIDSSPSLRYLGIWVEGIVVLTNKNAKFQLVNPTVTILKLPQLPNYILNRGSRSRFNRDQLETIAREIAKQKT